MFKYLVRLLPTSLIIKKYKDAGLDFGDAFSYLPAMGECIGFQKLLERWVFWEAEYARRGYHTIDLPSFVNSGGWGEELPRLCVKADKKPELYGARVLESYLNKNKSSSRKLNPDPYR